MVAPGKDAEHAHCIGGIGGFSKCDSINVNDRIRSDDDTLRTGCRDRARFFTRVRNGKIAWRQMFECGFVITAGDHLNAQSDRAQQLESPWGGTRENDLTQGLGLYWYVRPLTLTYPDTWRPAGSRCVQCTTPSLHSYWPSSST